MPNGSKFIKCLIHKKFTRNKMCMVNITIYIKKEVNKNDNSQS